MIDFGYVDDTNIACFDGQNLSKSAIVLAKTTKSIHSADQPELNLTNQFAIMRVNNVPTFRQPVN